MEEAKNNFSQILIVGEETCTGVIASLLKTKFESKGAQEDMIFISNKYFEADIKVEVFNLDDIETENEGYSKLPEQDKEQEGQEEEAKGGLESIDYSKYDTLILAHSDTCTSTIRQRCMDIAKSTENQNFEIKMLFISMNSYGNRKLLVEKFDREAWYDSSGTFLEILADDLEAVGDTWGQDLQDDYNEFDAQSLSKNQEWEEKEGINRLVEALEGCMWRNKRMKPKEPKKKKKKKKQDGGLFALMGQSLSSGQVKSKKKVKKIQEKKKEIENKVVEEKKKEIEPKVPEKIVDEDDKEFQDIEDFQKIFQEISSFKQISGNLSNDEKKKKAADLVMKLMQGMPGDEEDDVDN